MKKLFFTRFSFFFPGKCRLGISYKWYQVLSAAENLFAAISNLIKSHSSFRRQIISFKKAKINVGEKLISVVRAKCFVFVRTGCVKTIIVDKYSQVIINHISAS